MEGWKLGGSDGMGESPYRARSGSRARAVGGGELRSSRGRKKGIPGSGVKWQCVWMTVGHWARNRISGA